jgi:hypothetical protein
MHRLLEKSKKIKSQADKILKESGIIDIMRDYGEVKIGGSYALDVMLRPDLDFFIIREQHDWNKFLDIHSRIMKLKYFSEVNFANWIDFKDADLDFMPGYYIQPRISIEGQEWKMDIWFITPEFDKSAERTDYYKKLLEKESDEGKRVSILEVKEAMRQGRKYVEGVDGKLIYKAVLEDGIGSVAEFKDYLKNTV